MSSKRLHYSDFALTYEFLYGILTRFIVIGHRKVLPSAMVMEVVGFIRFVSQYLRTGYVNREHWVLVLPREGMVMDPDRTLKSYHVENGDKLILM